MTCGRLWIGARPADFSVSRPSFLLATVLSMDTPSTNSTSADAIDEIALLLVEMAEASDATR